MQQWVGHDFETTTIFVSAYRRSSGYRAEIDGLRAVAVTAVIVNHFDRTLLPGGYLGVDIFFVISGYVITSVLARSHYQTFGNFILDFYRRRIKRLIPALVFCCLITGLVLCLFDPDPSGRLTTGINALLGFSNISLYHQQVDYFGAAAEFDPFTHTWSLGVEEQFYLLFPSLAWMTGASRRNFVGRRKLFSWVLAASALSLFAFVYHQKTNQPAAYFLMHARFWELGFGCMAFLASGRISALSMRAPTRVLTSILFAFLAAALFAPRANTVPATVGVVVMTGLLIATIQSGTIPHRLLTYRPIVYIGLISYSLYLWHWSVLALSRWTVGVLGLYMPLQVVLMLVLAGISYHLVEAPLREAEWSPRRAITITYGISASLTGVLLFLLLARPWFGDPLSSRLYAGQVPEIQIHYSKLRKEAAKRVSCNIFDTGTMATQFPASCGAGQDAAKPTVYLLGDSHIFQFNAIIAQYAIGQGYNYRSVWGNSCLFPAATLYGESSECFRLQSALQAALIENIKAGDIVFIGNALYARFSGLWDGDRGDPARSGTLEHYAKAYSASLRSLAEQLVGKGVRVVIYLDGAQFVDFRGSEHCAEQWFAPHPPEQCFIAEQEFLYHRDRLFGWVREWARGPYRLAWDGMDDNTCGNGVCRATHYRDSNHFKAYYAAYIFEKFLAQHPELTSTAEPSPSAANQAAHSELQRP